MRELYFKFFFRMQHEIFYLEQYANIMGRRGKIYSVGLSVLASGSVATLMIWKKCPVLWSVVAFVTQILQAIKPHFQYDQRQAAIHYMLQDAQPLMRDIRGFWDLHMAKGQDLPDEDVEAAMSQFEKRYDEIAARFTGDIAFPVSRMAQRKAEKLNKNHFDHYSQVKS